MAFIANGEVTKPVGPRERALDDPAEHAKAAAVGRAATAEDRNNAAGGEAITMWLRIVALSFPQVVQAPLGKDQKGGDERRINPPEGIANAVT